MSATIFDPKKIPMSTVNRNIWSIIRIVKANVLLKNLHPTLINSIVVLLTDEPA